MKKLTLTIAGLVLAAAPAAAQNPEELFTRPVVPPEAVLNRLNHRAQVIGGVLAGRCAGVLSDFFAARRKQGKG